MNLDLLSLGGYGEFVWPAFIFTFTCCFFLYLKTRKELKKQEKIFLITFKQLPVTEIEVVGHEKTSNEVLSGSSSILPVIY
jgi:hypothetical protein|tara:strand:- start:229 stop:471 length:243 start_codon:yes stop_codon:yes gene_type:complete